MSGERPAAQRNIFGDLERYKDDQERLKWEGSFEEYFEKVIENPDIARIAYKTGYKAITSREDFFTTGRNALYGAEETIERFTEIFKAAADGHEIGRRIILLNGPPGSGKSTLVRGTKRGIEEYSKTDEGALYAIKDCPVHEEPLHLIPEDLRDSFEEDYGIKIEGDLCQSCKQRYIGDEFDPARIKEATVERLVISEKNRVGIGTFKPSDPKSQDISELIGAVDLAKLGEFGSASDVRAYKADGELQIANRGVMEFVEMLKSDVKFLYTLLDLTQDKEIKAPRFANQYVDEIILAHTNMTEYYKFVNNPANEALSDRMVVVQVPYTLKVGAESKIYEKLIGQSDRVKQSGVHISPKTLEMASTFSVLSRLAESKKYDKMKKLKIYDGQEIDGLTQNDLDEMKAEKPNEGMSGISPRYVIDALSLALTKGDKKCLNPMDALQELSANIENHSHTQNMKQEDKDTLKKDLQKVWEEFREVAKEEVSSAFIYAYDDAARSLANNYISNVVAFCTNTTIHDEKRGAEHKPDERLMRSIEEHIGINEIGKKEFRNELMMKIAAMAQRNLSRGDGEGSSRAFDYQNHPRLKEAIKKKLFSDMKDIIKLTTGAQVPDDKQQERMHNVKATLIQEKGYCEDCAGELIEYVGDMLNRAES